jgi:hypothetical protein
MNGSPILTSPFRPSTLYWRLGEKGELTDTAIEGRRPSATCVPFAPPTASTVQAELLLYENEREGLAFRQNGLVNRVRDSVDAWKLLGLDTSPSACAPNDRQIVPLEAQEISA